MKTDNQIMARYRQLCESEQFYLSKQNYSALAATRVALQEIMWVLGDSLESATPTTSETNRYEGETDGC